ncbi:MAG TPA: ATP-dependent DNA helicase [Burkholderiaceae bacterium]|nr:ATP-dependent DNA helicase [Burkholderiaceae bacterium]
MAAAVARAIEERSTLVVEAGTGVGKTFAYLVPVLQSGRRALVSTATKNLQDQLFWRDLPRLKQALNVPATTALLKGRASYLCPYRLERARTEATFADRSAMRALARIEKWAAATATGDLGELEGLDERSEVIPLVTSTRENCLGGDCPRFSVCPLMRARREALAADVVVVNHHLFFADLALREGGVAELLPTVDIAVFDEAHQMVDIGVQFLGQTLATGQAIDLARDLVGAGLQQARGLAPWSEHAARLELLARELRLAAAGPRAHAVGGTSPGGAGQRRAWEEVAAEELLAPALEALSAHAGVVADMLEPLEEIGPDFVRLRQRCTNLRALCTRFQGPAATGRVRWVDLTTHQARLIESPLDIDEPLRAQREAASRAWIFTSATLGDDDRLAWFTEPTGLGDARLLRVDSPFDYEANARVYVPARFAAPGDAHHAESVGRAAAHCAAALGGRTFVLTTTLRAMRAAAESLQAELAKLDTPLEVLLQGTTAKRTMLERFARGGCVLVGSQSFWEGIDVPGDALQCVLIDKLPFPPPNDPLIEARVKRLQAQGRDAFTDCFVAEAAVSLKQGAGRLIRSETDRGLLVICDSRLHHARYGPRLRAALPPMRPLPDGTQALNWLRELALTHK